MLMQHANRAPTSPWLPGGVAEGATGFGVMLSRTGRILSFLEKPKKPPPMRANPASPCAHGIGVSTRSAMNADGFAGAMGPIRIVRLNSDIVALLQSSRSEHSCSETCRWRHAAQKATRVCPGIGGGFFGFSRRKECGPVRRHA